MKILMAEHTHYRSLFQVGCHHIARGLAELGHEITYISWYLSPLHVLNFATGKRKEVLSRFSNYLNGGIHETKNLYTYVPFTLSPLVKLPLFDNMASANRTVKWTLPNLPNKLNQNGKYDAFLIGDPRFVPLIGQIKADKVILRLTDNVTEFENSPKVINQLIKIGVKKANQVIVTSKPLIEIMQEKYDATNVSYIPNGVDYSHFATEAVEPDDLKHIPKPRVTYIGAIENWFDCDLLAKVSQAMPEVSFIIIGPIRTDISKAENLPNVYFLGPKPYKELPNYLQHSDVGAIFFKRTPLIESVSPIKLYEYMAAGLPVVSIEWNELKLLNSPALLASNKDEFITALKHVLSDDRGDGVYREYARGNSWMGRVECIEKLIRDEK
jgi:glycosyltransferase involved in cell wall biosynthesis